jgi:hypothetical protein
MDGEIKMSPMKTKTATHGIREKEMRESMLPLKKTSQPVRTDKTITTLAFTIFGQHDELTDEHGNSDSEGFPLLYDVDDGSGKIIPSHTLTNAFAKVVMGTKIRYFVKTNSNGKFFNPMGLFTENRHNKNLKHAGKAEWEYKEVSHTVFMFYVSFLKTRNKARLLVAQREND